MRDIDLFLSPLASQLQRAGLDIVHPLMLRWYNSCLEGAALASSIPVTGRAGDSALTILIGNSRALWQPFLSACSRHADVLEHHDPLETYVERSVLEALNTTLPQRRVRVFWSHELAELNGGRAFVAMQRMASCSGLAHLDTVSHLCMHPKFGTWFSLRCVIVLDDDPYIGSPTPPQLFPCPMDTSRTSAVAAAVALAMGNKANGTKPAMNDVKDRWKFWLAVRDAAAPHHPFRYSNEQIVYHYTGNRQLLRQLVSSNTSDLQSK